MIHHPFPSSTSLTKSPITPPKPTKVFHHHHHHHHQHDAQTPLQKESMSTKVPNHWLTATFSATLPSALFELGNSTCSSGIYLDSLFSLGGWEGWMEWSCEWSWWSIFSARLKKSNSVAVTLHLLFWRHTENYPIKKNAFTFIRRTDKSDPKEAS